jgi:Glycosyl hydrolase family 26
VSTIPRAVPARPGSPEDGVRGRHRPLRRSLRALACGVPTAVALAAGVIDAAPAHAAQPVLLGSAGDAAALSRNTGQQLAVHTYRQFSQSVPGNAAMITVGAGNTGWRAVANAGPGSALYGDIVRWAQTIKGRPGRLLLAYHHEPEATASSGLGSPADFIAAHQHVVSIFRQQGVTNVQWVWQMTAFSFRANPSDRRNANNWYPGDAWVDVVGADGYTWRNCFGHNEGWSTMASFADPVLAFARAHGKAASLPEFGAADDARRAQWLQDARQYMAANKDVLQSAFYFNRGRDARGCTWVLTTRAEYDAFGSTARDPNFRTS